MLKSKLRNCETLSFVIEEKHGGDFAGEQVVAKGKSVSVCAAVKLNLCIVFSKACKRFLEILM